jgi:aspartyl-tRNA(Asn)/glutamyl-tRNA(Gln) amidotransferase subunit C
MNISAKDVEYVAKLAMLEVPESEGEELARQLSGILDYVEQLNRVDVSQIAPTAQVQTSLKHAIRDDRVVTRTGSADAGRSVRLFKVPKVITER